MALGADLFSAEGVERVEIWVYIEKYISVCVLTKDSTIGIVASTLHSGLTIINNIKKLCFSREIVMKENNCEHLLTGPDPRLLFLRCFHVPASQTLIPPPLQG